ncbi:hypothetical protein A9R05_39945 (plasmid) [Burkholderia sp. KK1]|nr:hypothetical protein A9R05_39945 [Burkholderia sp. KK1]
MAARERNQIRLNGYVSEDSDKVLYEALTFVNPYKRMAVLRRLATLGLTVDQARTAARPFATPETPQTVGPVALPETVQAARTPEPTPPPTQAISEPKTPASDCVVTATAGNELDGEAAVSEQRRTRKFALMGKMDVSIMD